jgi:hypothetical protein
MDSYEHLKTLFFIYEKWSKSYFLKYPIWIQHGLLSQFVGVNLSRLRSPDKLFFVWLWCRDCLGSRELWHFAFETSDFKMPVPESHSRHIMCIQQTWEYASGHTGTIHRDYQYQTRIKGTWHERIQSSEFLVQDTITDFM